jgi:XRE family aerobic/anaerobic benzoate catabolism transcriptional regulator
MQVREAGMTDRAISLAQETGDLGGYLKGLGERVRILRSRRGMSRKALAAHSDVSERYLAQLESGTGNCSIVLLRRIAQALSVPLAELIDERPQRSIESVLVMQLLDRLNPAELSQARDFLLSRFGGTTSEMRRGRIALIGLRGGGKSTLGRLLADELGYPFIELDREIERESGMDLIELFEMFGQPTFRRMERATLEAVLEKNRRFVLATGGGLVTEPATFELLLASCFTIWVKASPEEHMHRVIEQGDLRPISGNLRAMDDLVSILHSRMPLYAKADAALETTGLSPPQALRRALKLVGAAKAGRSRLPAS